MDRACGYFGNPWIGMFVKTNDNFTFVPSDVPPQLVSKLEQYLETEVVKVTVADSNLVGIYLAMNSGGVVVPSITNNSELAILRKTGLNVYPSDSRMNAHGNNIVVNDKGGIINTNIPWPERKKMEDALGVELVPATVAGYSTVGSSCLANNEGFLVHFNASQEDVDVISDALKVRGVKGSVNTGVGFISYGVVANNRNYVAGLNTTAFEAGRVEEALGFLG